MPSLVAHGQESGFKFPSEWDTWLIGSDLCLTALLGLLCGELTIGWPGRWPLQYSRSWFGPGQ